MSAEHQFESLADRQRALEESVVFASKYHGEDIAHFVAIGGDGKVIARSFAPQDREAMREWLQEHIGKLNIYFQINGLYGAIRNRKAKKEHIEYARAVQVDIDDMDGLARLHAFPIPPTVIIFTGGGYQALWLFSEVVRDLDGVERINAAVAAALRGDACWNIDRLFRLPGTVNVLNAKKRKAGRVPALARIEFADWSRRYGVGDFAEYDRPLPLVSAKPTQATIADLVPIGLDQLSVPLDPLTVEIVKRGDHPDLPRGKPNSHFPSRSEAVFRVVCALAAAGCTEVEIAGILVNPDHGISESILERNASRAYALKQALAGIEAISGRWPDPDKAGQPRATMRNTVVALRRMELRFSQDLFRHLKIVNGYALEQRQGEVSDDVCVVLRSMIIDHFNFDPKAENVWDAVNQLCLENGFHPILEMLDALQWDGVPRLDRWLHVYTGAEDTSLNQAFGAIFLIAAVRRVRQPGVKFDTVLILEGTQGSGKSTALQIIAGPGNHSDNEVLTLDTKSQMEAMQGIWIYELGEISGLRKAEVEKVKAFASRQVDRARMAYGRFSESRARQLVFVGTTNEDKYLRDLTGNRRFWPVKTDTIDLDALRRDRDQLLAEAAYREAQGKSIVLPEELWAVAAIEQEARLEEDPWAERLEAVSGQAVGDEARVYTSFLMTETLGIEFERQQSNYAKRLSSLMRKLGWEPAKFKVAGKTVRGFKRPVRAGHIDDDKKPGVVKPPF